MKKKQVQMRLNKNKIVTAGIFISIALGIYFDSIEILKLAIPYILASLLFFNFLKIDLKVSHFFRKELLYFPIIFFFIIPPIIYFSTSFFSYDLRIGLFILAITPTAIGAPVVAGLTGSDRELVVSHVMLINLLSPLSYSLLIHFWFNKGDVEIPTFLILKKIALIIIIPLLTALLVKKCKNTKRILSRISPYYVPAAFLLIIFSAVSSASLRLKSLDIFQLLSIAAIVFIMALVFFSTGFLLSKKRKISISLSLMFGHRNTALSIWVILSNFSPESVIPLILYIIFHHTFNAGLLYLSGKK